MANGSKIIEETILDEGRYDFPSLDGTESETYKGIDRKWDYDWAGWVIIDLLKNSPGFPGILESSIELQGLVHEFYRKLWETIHGDQIPSQVIAEKMYEMALLEGPYMVKALQRSLNLLNINEMFYPDLKEDGVFGPVTLVSLMENLKNISPRHLLRLLTIFQGMRFCEACWKTKEKRRNMKGWLNRAFEYPELI